MRAASSRASSPASLCASFCASDQRCRWGRPIAVPGADRGDRRGADIFSTGIFS